MITKFCQITCTVAVTSYYVRLTQLLSLDRAIQGVKQKSAICIVQL